MSPALQSRIVYDEPARVVEFFASHMPEAAFGAHTAIGLERGGRLIAGVVYDGFTGPNAAMHVAALPGKSWLRRDYLRACFAYPFVQLGCNRVTGLVSSTNAGALKFDFALGFEYETMLKGAVPGGDLLVLVMWKQNCRWLNLRV